MTRLWCTFRLARFIFLLGLLDRQFSTAVVIVYCRRGKFVFELAISHLSILRVAVMRVWLRRVMAFVTLIISANLLICALNCAAQQARKKGTSHFERIILALNVPFYLSSLSEGTAKQQKRSLQYCERCKRKRAPTAKAEKSGRQTDCLVLPLLSLCVSRLCLTVSWTSLYRLLLSPASQHGHFICDSHRVCPSHFIDASRSTHTHTRRNISMQNTTIGISFIAR